MHVSLFHFFFFHQNEDSEKFRSLSHGSQMNSVKGRIIPCSGLDTPPINVNPADKFTEIENMGVKWQKIDKHLDINKILERIMRFAFLIFQVRRFPEQDKKEK